MSLMDILKRLLGISGNNSSHAATIARLADESASESRQLNAQLREYSKSADPFTAMMIDLHNKRTANRMDRAAR